MLKYEVPAVYDIIRSMSQSDVLGEPPYLLIKIVCENSKDPSLKKPKFFRYLEEYRKEGLYCKRPKILTPEREVYYKAIRQKKLNAYIEEHKQQLLGMKNVFVFGSKRIIKR